MMIRRDEILPLTGLRGVAALLVVAHHAQAATLSDRTTVFFRGQLWVDLFFVLSGYVMTMVYLSSPKVNFPRFYLARFSRVYPLHVVTAAMMALSATALAVFSHHAHPSWISWPQLIRELTFTVPLPYIGSHEIWNYPSWSVACEWWVYVFAFPLLAIFGNRLSALTWAIAIGLAMVVLACMLQLLPSDYRFTRGWVAVARAFVGFIAGYATYRMEEKSPDIRLPGWLYDTIMIIIVVGNYLLPPYLGYRDPWFLMIGFPILIYGAAHSKSITTRLLQSPALVYLGQISYSIYLTHALVVQVWHTIAVRYSLGGDLLALSVSLAGSIALSAITFKFVEIPCRNALRAGVKPMALAVR
jgi:peptidoglycan/LPS O-acetylase OafA/YrhL